MATIKKDEKTKWFLEGPFYRYNKDVAKVALVNDVQIIDSRRASKEMREAIEAPKSVIDTCEKGLEIKEEYKVKPVVKGESGDAKKLKEELAISENEKGVLEARAKQAEQKAVSANKDTNDALELAEKATKETDVLKARIAELEKKLK
jgi:hypothetical protein